MTPPLQRAARAIADDYADHPAGREQVAKIVKAVLAAASAGLLSVLVRACSPISGPFVMVEMMDGPLPRLAGLDRNPMREVRHE